MSTSTTSTIAEEFQIQIKREAKNGKFMQLASFIILAALVIIFSIAAPGFLSGTNALVLITQLAIPLIIASGVTFVVLVGGIDLSVDGLMGLSAAIIGMLVLNNKTGLNLGLWAIPIVLLIGAACGSITGLIHVKGKIPSFMVTFCMLSITTGIGVVIYDAIPPVIADQTTRSFALVKIAGLPLFVYVSLIVFIVAILIEKKTAFGKYMFAVGENEAIAKVAGINVNKIKISVFIWSGVLVSVAGIMGAAQMGRGDVTVGTGQTFAALAAIVLGGTPLTGGKGGIANTLLGAIIITVLNNGLVLIGVNPYLKNAITGIILVAAIIISLDRNPKQVTK